MSPTPGQQRPRLDRDRVVAAAIALVDDEGLPSLSMRTLAQRLGVKAMSLYNHVANKDDLIDGMVDVIYGQIDLPTGPDWMAAMRARAVSARQVLNRHPWAIALMESRSVPGPANLRHHDTVLGVLRQAGLSVPSATFAYSLLDSYVYGFALQEASLPFGTPDELATASDAIVQLMPADVYPHLREAAAELPASGFGFADQFDAGLDLLLEALERLQA
jgi:AcrR family transcriptional regulator